MKRLNGIAIVACALALITVGCGNDNNDLLQKPQIAPDRTQLNFGSDFSKGVYVGTQPSNTLKIKNEGQEDLVITSVTISPSNSVFYLGKEISKTTIPSLDSAFVEVIYAPQSAGADSATLTIESNAENSPTLKIQLSGVAIDSDQ